MDIVPSRFFIFILLITIAYLLKKQNDKRIKQIAIKGKISGLNKRMLRNKQFK